MEIKVVIDEKRKEIFKGDNLKVLLQKPDASLGDIDRLIILEDDLEIAVFSTWQYYRIKK